MGFLDSLSKTLSSGVDRAKFEADKFQRTSKISGEINNIKSQIDTNTRQLGERALELYQQGSLTAPEIASLAQIIGQLRDQQVHKETELTTAQGETFEVWQATQPQPEATTSQNVPISSEPSTSFGGTDVYSSTVPPSTPTSADYSMPSSASIDASTAKPSYISRSYNVPESTDMSGSGMPNTSSVGGSDAGAVGVGPVGSTPYACPSCGYSVPNNAVFCPNCGTRVTRT